MSFAAGMIPAALVTLPAAPRCSLLMHASGAAKEGVPCGEEGKMIAELLASFAEVSVPPPWSIWCGIDVNSVNASRDVFPAPPPEKSTLQYSLDHKALFLEPYCIQEFPVTLRGASLPEKLRTP